MKTTVTKLTKRGVEAALVIDSKEWALLAVVLWRHMNGYTSAWGHVRDSLDDRETGVFTLISEFFPNYSGDFSDAYRAVERRDLTDLALAEAMHAHLVERSQPVELTVEASGMKGFPIFQGEGFTKLVKEPGGEYFVVDGDGDKVRIDNVEAIVKFLTA